MSGRVSKSAEEKKFELAASVPSILFPVGPSFLQSLALLGKMADWLECRRETEKITRNGEIAVKQRSLPLSMFCILRSLDMINQICYIQIHKFKLIKEGSEKKYLA